MRLSDYIIEFLANEGIKDVFTVVGGGSIWLCDSLSSSNKVNYVCCHNEMYASIAAEAYARARSDIGAAIVTCGPGGTNTVTGVAGAWLDHVPHITISGQSFQSQTIPNCPGLRTLGVQEINIVDIVRPVTKYAVMVTDPKLIKYHLEKAFYLAKNDRPGPVWLDIPGDVQNAQIEPTDLVGFSPPNLFTHKKNSELAKIQKVVNLLKDAKRPLIHIGHGVRLSGAIDDFFALIEKLKIPFVTARNANDIVDSDHIYYVGRPGTYAQRGANFAVQTCDLYIAIGTRLSLAQTGYNSKDYARNAKRVVVDIDHAELNKKTMDILLKIQLDAGEFIKGLIHKIPTMINNKIEWKNWLSQCKKWQKKYPVVLKDYENQDKFVNSYYFIDKLSEVLDEDSTVVTDMGFSFQNTHQAFHVKNGQRLFTNCGLASMGWGLPASVGACFGSGLKKTVLIAGEGGLMMTIGELATIMHHKLPVKIFIFNNGGYLTIKQTQEAGFDSKYMGINKSTGISFPNFEKLALAYDIPFIKISNQKNLKNTINQIVYSDGPNICELIMDENQETSPRIMKRKKPDGTMSQAPIEDLYPFLNPEELEENLNIAK